MAHFPEKKLEMLEKEMGEIALAIIRDKLREGMRFTPHFRRKIGKKVKELGLNLDRVMIFAEILTREVMEEAFSFSEKENSDKKLFGKAFDEFAKKK